MQTDRRIILYLLMYAIAMAQVEASIVVHLRSLYYPQDPLHIFPLHLFSHRDLAIELVRELATVLMILAVSFLATKGFLRRFAAFVFVFGCWDIFYYVFLKIMLDWPQSWWEWDVLFLIPWPWFAPWLTALAIAVLFVVWGAVVLLRHNDASWKQLRASHARPISFFLLGVALGLFSFLLPALPLLSGGEQAFLGYTPTVFAWYSYLSGLALMLIGLLGIGKKRMAEALD